MNRRHHDMGGLPAGPIDREDTPQAPWEKRVRVLRVLLAKHDPPLVRVDEMRRAIEDLDPADYDRLGYYERWITALTRVLLEKGVLDEAALRGRMGEVAERWQAARDS